MAVVNANVLAACVRVITVVASAIRHALTRIWSFAKTLVPAFAPIGGAAKHAAFIAVASSLSPPK
jgi:hypothetical protein